MTNQTSANYDLIVIGAGSGGLTAAIGGAGIGAKILLIEKNKIGGDCTHTGCVPSKTLIKAGKLARQIRQAEKYGLRTKSPLVTEYDIHYALEKVQQTVEEIAAEETPAEIEKYGIEVVIGTAQFVDQQTVEANGTHYRAKRIIIATGSRPRIPGIPGLDKIDYLTNEQIFLPRAFNSLAVIGGGPIGCELAQAFAHLGVTVHLINNESHLLGREDQEASEVVQSVFEKEGITLHLSRETTEVADTEGKKTLSLTSKLDGKAQTIAVDQILVATGRQPNIEDLNLEKAGIEYDHSGIKIKNNGATNVRGIHAIGDVAGAPYFTHLANHHAKVALTNLIFWWPAKYEQAVIPRVTFTTPEVASVGISEEDARVQHDLIVLKKPLSEIDRARTDSATEGFYKIIVDKKGFLQGAVLVSEGAGELIGEISLAMKNRLTITQIADTIHPYPTYGYGLRHTADQFRAMQYTKRKQWWVKRLFGLSQ